MLILISMFSLQSWVSILTFLAVLLILTIQNRTHVWDRIKGFMYYLPLMYIVYLIISVGILGSDISQAASQAGFISLKFFGMVQLMALYLLWGKNELIIPALRTGWIHINKPWIAVENMFLFLALILRFFPSFQKDWEMAAQSDKALGIHQNLSLGKKIEHVIKHLPVLFTEQYRKADDITNQMIQRGYGSVVPRSIAFPIVWSLRDTMTILLSTLLFIGFFVGFTI